MLALPGTLSVASWRGDEDRTSILKPGGRTRTWNGSGQIRFVLHDPLEHPFYWWPRTLLSYPIRFDPPVALDHLVLTRVDTHERVPIQFSEVVHGSSGVESATLHFFSDLPSGAQREFVLTSVSTPVIHLSQVSERREGSTIVLDSGGLQVRIPASQEVHGTAPGPILQVARDGRWVGSSTLSISDDRVTRISASRTAHGPLFIDYEMAYDTIAGSRYVAQVRCQGGMDFIRLQENMDGLRPGARGSIRSTWAGFDPTHRQAPNHPFPLPEQIQSYDEYGWEGIDEAGFPQDVRFAIEPAHLCRDVCLRANCP